MHSKAENKANKKLLDMRWMNRKMVFLFDATGAGHPDRPGACDKSEEGRSLTWDRSSLLRDAVGHVAVMSVYASRRVDKDLIEYSCKRWLLIDAALSIHAVLSRTESTREDRLILHSKRARLL